MDFEVQAEGCGIQPLELVRAYSLDGSLEHSADLLHVEDNDRFLGVEEEHNVGEEVHRPLKLVRSSHFVDHEIN